MLSSESPIIAFNDIALDLGSFIGDFVGPVLDTVSDVLEPVMPLIDALTAPVPVISELAEAFSGLALDYVDPLADRKEGISIYDMASAIQNIKPDPRLGLVLAVIDVVDIIYDVSSVAADGVIELGSFVIGGSSEGADVRTAPDLSTFGRNEQPEDTTAQLDQPGGKSAKSFIEKSSARPTR